MDDAVVRDLYDRLLASWNARNADSFAAMFAPDGTSIGFDGTIAVGDGIADHLREVFGDHATARYVAKVRTVRPVGAHGAVLRAIAGLVPPGKHELNPDANAHQTLIAESAADGGWHIVLFQNTPAQYHGRPDLVTAHTAELAPLLPGPQPS
jgi:uncharacterized protein (TIGR02246 family)